MTRTRILAGAAAIGVGGLLLIQAGEGTGPTQMRADGRWFCAYADPATKNDPIKKGKPWTIGYGHTGPEVKPGLCIPEKQANDTLLKDVRVAVNALAQCVKVPVHENELGALASLTINVGGANMCGPPSGPSSTLVGKLNAGDNPGAANEFLRWNRANGKVMGGLTKRRACERRLFLTEPTDANRDATIAMVKACIRAGAPA